MVITNQGSALSEVHQTIIFILHLVA